MSDKKIPDSLDDYLTGVKTKVMAESMERIFKMLRAKAERYKSKCEKDKSDKNTKKFLHSAQDFYHFTELLNLLEMQTAQVMMLTELVNDLSSRLEGELGLDFPPVSNDPGGSNEPN